MKTLFLFCWDKTAAQQKAKELRSAGWKVDVESEDGARGGKKVLTTQPRVVVMDLAKRPSHSRETAQGLRSYKAGRDIPIIFVDGSDDDIKKTKVKVPDGIFITSAGLAEALERYLEPVDH